MKSKHAAIITLSCFLLTFFAPVLALAVDAPPEQGGVGIYTKAAVGDPSLAMISKIVGGVDGVFPSVDTPLTHTFMVFNVGVLAISITFLLWNFGSGIVQTAHDGEFLGKRFHSIWMPIRNTIGVGGLIPAFGGWAACQIVMMWATTIGIGLANLTWQAGYESMIGYISTPITTPTVALSDTTIQSIIKAQTCMLGQNEMMDNASSVDWGGKVTTGLFDGKARFRKHGPAHTSVVMGSNVNGLQTTEGDGITLAWGGQGVNDYPVDICGGVRLPSQAITKGANGSKRVFSVTEAARPVVDRGMVSAAHGMALGEMASALLPISKGILHGHYPTSEQIIKVKDDYLQKVGGAISNEVLKANSEFANYMREGGTSWVNAGTIFAKIGDVNKEVMQAANIQIQPIGTDKIERSEANGIVDYGGAMQGIRAYQAWREKLGIGGQDGEAKEGKFSLLSPDLSLLFQPFRSNAVSGAITALTRGDTDLLSGLINLGHTIEVAAPAGVAAIWGTLAGAEMIGGGKILGSGPGGVSGTAGAAASAVWWVGIFMTVIGVFLGVYLPFLPTIIWYGAVLSWAITIVEAIIAAPLWMFTHMEAEGEGMGQKTAYGYLFLINVLFRPTLMIMSLITAWLLLDVFGYFLKETLVVLYGASSYAFSGISGFFTFLGVLVVFTSLGIMTVEKCFGLIDILPNQIFAWVGGHYQGTGGTDAHRESKQAFVGGVQNMRQQAQGRQQTKSRMRNSNSGPHNSVSNATADEQINK